MTNDELIKMVREVAAPETIDPVTSDGAFVVITPDELREFAQMVLKVFASENCIQKSDSQNET